MYMNVFRMNVLLILILCVWNVNACGDENDDDDFIDIGIQLNGDNRDILIADLIAEEKDLYNAGHVSISMIEEWKREHLVFSYIDCWHWFASFSHSTKMQSKI